MSKSALAILLVVGTMNGVAADTFHARAENSIDLIVASQSEHLSGGDFNEQHNGVAVEWCIESDGRWRTLLAGGRLISSHDEPAWYGTVGLKSPIFRTGRFHVEAGGYFGLGQSDAYYRGDIFPFAAPSLAAYFGRLGLNVTLIPPLNDNAAVVLLQVKVGIHRGD